MKRRKKSKKIIIFLLIFILIVVLGFFSATILYKSSDNEVKVIKTISKYGYSLNENETPLYNKEFDNLKSILDKDEIDYEQYAKSISKLFIIDFYTLSNKMSRNDIGGVDFIMDDMKDNFIQQARSTFYKYIKTDSKDQNLPEVSEITSISIEKGTFYLKDLTTTTKTSYNKKYEKNNGVLKECYNVKISWDYKEDLEYETEAVITLINDNNKLYIVEMD